MAGMAVAVACAVADGDDPERSVLMFAGFEGCTGSVRVCRECRECRDVMP